MRIKSPFRQNPAAGSPTYPFKATLIQRFGALMLDTGFLLVILVAGLLLYKSTFGLAWERPHYVPPHPSMGWSRVWRSLAFFSPLFIVLAAFLSSPLRATFGMAAFHLHAERSSGARLSFLHALGWQITTFLPLLAANYLILIGIALEVPLIHLGLLNLFNLMLVLQCIWFFPVLLHRDKKAVPDYLWGVRVVYSCDRPEGMPLIRRVFYLPFLGVILFIMGFVSAYGTINLFDRPEHPRITALRKNAPANFHILKSTWRNEAGFEISVKLADFRCASKETRFHQNDFCQPYMVILDTISENRHLIDNYKAKFIENNGAYTPKEFMTRESVFLTDLVLADLIVRLENGEEDLAIENWLKLANFWKGALRQPGFLIAKSTILMHYNHVLLALPALVNTRTELIDAYEDAIFETIAPIAYDQVMVDNIMRYEFAHYDRILSRSLIDYFPLIQPNDTRNQFMLAVKAVELLFSNSGQLLSEQKRRLEVFADKYRWNRWYNPLGTKFRDLAIQNVAYNLHAISTFHQNNALKKMLYIFMESRRLEIPFDNMGAFLQALPEERRTVFGDRSILWDPAQKALYYIPGKAAGFHHALQF